METVNFAIAINMLLIKIFENNNDLSKYKFDNLIDSFEKRRICSFPNYIWGQKD